MIWFSSDHHFGHTNIVTKYNRRNGYYKSIEHMNEDLIQRWNETVSPDDTVYYLGDFSLGYKYARDITPQLNGTKILIAGNHDLCHPCHKKKYVKFIAHYKEWGWTNVYEKHHITTPIGEVLLCHLPYLREGEDQRYQSFRPVDKGGYLIHGHVHELYLKKGRGINVGVDRNDFKPVSMDRVVEILKGEDQ